MALRAIITGGLWVVARRTLLDLDGSKLVLKQMRIRMTETCDKRRWLGIPRVARNTRLELWLNQVRIMVKLR